MTETNSLPLRHATVTEAKQPLTKNQINVILQKIALNILADAGSWRKIGSDLDLTDHDLSRVWDHAKAQLIDF